MAAKSVLCLVLLFVSTGKMRESKLLDFALLVEVNSLIVFLPYSKLFIAIILRLYRKVDRKFSSCHLCHQMASYFLIFLWKQQQHLMSKRVIYHVVCYDFWNRKLNYTSRIFFSYEPASHVVTLKLNYRNYPTCLFLFYIHSLKFIN